MGLLRRREVGSLLMHASIPILHVSFFLWDFCIFSFFFSFFTLLSFLSYYPCFLPLFFFFFFPPFFTIHGYGLLYCLSLQDLPFLPLNRFWLIVGVLPRLPTGLLAAQPLPLHCVGYTTPYSETKKVFVLSFISILSSG